MDETRIRRNIFAFSNLFGYVWTGPKQFIAEAILISIRMLSLLFNLEIL